MSKVLVSGGNGFVAAWVIISTINRGYEVVATVRTPEKAEQTKQALSSQLGSNASKLSFYIIPDIEAEGAFDEVIKAYDFIAVLHTATPFHVRAKDPNEITGPAVNGTKSILRSIKTFGTTIKRVVITSSFASVIDPKKGLNPGYTYTEKDWNPISWEETHNGDPSNAYYGAKTWAEKAAWQFMEDEKPDFQLITLNPPTVLGDTTQYVESAAQLNTSSARPFSILAGTIPVLPLQPIMTWVDVKDLGNAHALAIDAPEAGGHRFLINADEPYTYKQMADIFIQNHPERAASVATKLPEGVDENGFPVGGFYHADNSLSKKLLGLQYRKFDNAMTDFMESTKKFLPSS